MAFYSTDSSGQLWRIDVNTDGTLQTTAVSGGSVSFAATESPSLNGQSIVKRALRMIGAISSGENLKAEEERDGLEALNHLLDSWNAESMLVFAATRKEFPLLQQSVQTIGPGGDLNGQRPIKIEDGSAYLKMADGTERKLSVWDKDNYAHIALKETPGMPAVLYYDANFPLGSVYLYPKPDKAYTLVLYTPVQLDAVDASSELTLPPGYADAIVWNLAVMLAPEYGKLKEIAPIAALAAQKKQVIARANAKDVLMSCDSALILNCNSLDIRTGR